MTHLNRRNFLRVAGVAAGALILPAVPARAEEKEKSGFTLPKLPYDYDALKPAIGEETMKIHHDRHHAAYVNNLNTALKDYPDLLKMPIEELMRDVDKVPEKIRQAVINNGGGHLNHSMFWQMMAPKGKGGEPKGDLLKAIEDYSGSLDKFQAAFTDAAMKRFGSGWAWLALAKNGKLVIISLPNQDPVYRAGAEPLLGIDVWEHAYYLDYQNKRGDYVKNWWTVVNWDNVAERFNHAKKG
jgi:Fe-Mn family superoxide dismutase